MKRIISLVMTLLIIISFVGCNKEEKENIDSTKSTIVSSKEIDSTKSKSESKKETESEEKKEDEESTDETKTKEKEESSTKKSDKKSDSKTTTKKSSGTTKKSSNTTTKKSSTTTTAKKTTTTTKATATTTASDANDALRKQIESTYGVTINYGNEKVLVSGTYLDYTPGAPGQYSTTRLTDTTKINKCLNDLSKVLAGYPTGFFKDFKNFGSPITFVLLEYSNAFSGYADSQYGDSLIVSLVYSEYQFSFTANHEIMHCIDKYLSFKLYGTGVKQYDAYKALNPSGFQYSYDVETYESYSWPTSYEKYCFNNTLSNGETIYFVSTYSLTNVREDRAEIFKYMMRETAIPSYIMKKSSVTKAKADIIAQQIQTYFPSASGGIPNWEKNKKSLTS